MQSSIYNKRVRAVQEEFARQFIHDGVEITDVVKHCRSQPGCSLSYQTVQRFLQLGKSGSRVNGFTHYVRGPYATTVFAIADALGMQLRTVKPGLRPAKGAQQ